MSGVLNDCDALLQAAGVRFLIGNGASVNLVASAPGFHLNSAGVADLARVTVTADLIGFDGTVSFSASGGSLTNAAARSVEVNYAGGSAIVTATVAAGGETFTRSLVIPVLRDGAAGVKGDTGNTGTSPNKNGIAFLYKWSTAAPAKPAGTSTFGWSSASNTAYGGTDGWSIAVPNNPGTPLIQLFVASIAVTEVAVATSTTVSYASSIVAAWAQNGANGTNGSNGSNGVTGVQSGEVKVYQWAATIPAGPVGSPTYAWSTSNFGAAPTNWTLTPGAAPSPGMTLWMARVGITDSAAATSTSFNWTAASILAVGYAGSNGTNGSNGANGGDGAEGVSYVTAYCASATASTATVPAATTGKASVPAVNGGGITGTWSKTVPALTSGQFMYQSDGLYNPANNQVAWSIPYWSSLKVGTLSAITANLGAITGGSIDIGAGTTSWHVDSLGNMWIGASAFGSAPFRVLNTGVAVMRGARVEMADGTVVLDATQSLAQQVRSAPNLVPRLSSWTKWQSPNVWIYQDPMGRSANGEIGIIEPAVGGYWGFDSPYLPLVASDWVTVSFVATAPAGTVLNVDIYGSNGQGGYVDTVGKTGIVLTGAGLGDRHVFTEQLPAAVGNVYVRMWRGSNTGQIGIWDVKVSKGKIDSPYSDDIITASNAKNMVQIPNLSTMSAYAGSLEIGPGGNIRQGMTYYNQGVGMWMGQDGGINKFMVGNPNGALMWWDGNSLQTKGMGITAPVYAPFSVYAGGPISAGTSSKTYSTTRTATITGSENFKSIQWSVSDFSDSGSISITSGADALTVSIRSQTGTFGVFNSAMLTATVAGLDGRTTTHSIDIDVNHY